MILSEDLYAWFFNTVVLTLNTYNEWHIVSTLRTSNQIKQLHFNHQFSSTSFVTSSQKSRSTLNRPVHFQNIIHEWLSISMSIMYANICLFTNRTYLSLKVLRNTKQDLSFVKYLCFKIQYSIVNVRIQKFIHIIISRNIFRT